MIKKNVVIVLLVSFLLVSFAPHRYNFDARDLLLPKDEIPEDWGIKSIISGKDNRSVLDDFPFVSDIAIETHTISGEEVLGRSLHAIYPIYFLAFLGLLKFGFFENAESNAQFLFDNWRPRIYVQSCSQGIALQGHKACRHVYMNGTIISRLDIVFDANDKNSSMLLELFQQRIDLLLITR
jgi:hypothetical protein